MNDEAEAVAPDVGMIEETDRICELSGCRYRPCRAAAAKTSENAKE